MIDPIPPYLAAALRDPPRRRAILATARTLLALPEDTALLMIEATYQEAHTDAAQLDASAVGYFVLHPDTLTLLEPTP